MRKYLKALILVGPLALYGCDGTNGPSVSSISLDGTPAQLSAGQQGAIHTVATFTDGSTQDITCNASYSTSNPYALTVDPAAGVMDGAAAGGAVLTAMYESRVTQLAVTVTEGGTASPVSAPCK